MIEGTFWNKNTMMLLLTLRLMIRNLWRQLLRMVGTFPSTANHPTALTLMCLI